MMTGNIIGVVGGVGPYAGLDLVRKIFDQTIASTDQEHLPVALLSYSELISERTDFILGETNQNPAAGIITVLKQLELIGATVAGIPCNTAHAPSVFDQINTNLATRSSPIQLMHMIEETAHFMRTHHSEIERVGVLSTQGTYLANIYPRIMQDANFAVLTPGEEEQRNLVNTAIYDEKYGIKAQSNPVSKRARTDLLTAAKNLIAAGAQAIILGCTEVPLALPEKNIESTPLVDPTLILARALVRAATPHKLKPLPEKDHNDRDTGQS